MRYILVLFLLPACAKTAVPVAQAPAFGVTMVEETQCIGQGGRIVMEGGPGRCELP